jgi:hypothetical protein
VSKCHPRFRRPATPPCVPERLENRCLLSGNVTVAYDAATNTVTVVGDNKSNEIVLRGSLGGGVYTISGAAGTKVNGGPLVTLPVVGSNGSNFNVSLGNGDDVVRAGAVAPAFVPFTLNSLSISTGNGDDTVALGDVTVRSGGLRVATGNGDDTVSLEFTDVLGGLSILTGNGDDVLTAGPEVNVVTGPSLIDAGRGFDVFNGRPNLDVLVGTRRDLGFE